MASILVIYIIYTILLLAAAGFITVYATVNHPWRMIAVLLLLIVMPAIGIYIFAMQISTLPETRVSDFVGLSAGQAETLAQSQGLKTQVVQKIYVKDAPEGQVVSQRPEAGRAVKVGRTVNLITSIGARNVYVPNLVGKDSAQVDVVVKEAGLLLGETRYVTSLEFPAGTVVAQTPSAGEEVPAGSIVEITICHNPQDETEGPDAQEE